MHHRVKVLNPIIILYIKNNFFTNKVNIFVLSNNSIPVLSEVILVKNLSNLLQLYRKISLLVLKDEDFSSHYQSPCRQIIMMTLYCLNWEIWCCLDSWVIWGRGGGCLSWPGVVHTSGRSKRQRTPSPLEPAMIATNCKGDVKKRQSSLIGLTLGFKAVVQRVSARYIIMAATPTATLAPNHRHRLQRW